MTFQNNFPFDVFFRNSTHRLRRNSNWKCSLRIIVITYIKILRESQIQTLCGCPPAEQIRLWVIDMGGLASFATRHESAVMFASNRVSHIILSTRGFPKMCPIFCRLAQYQPMPSTFVTICDGDDGGGDGQLKSSSMYKQLWSEM